MPSKISHPDSGLALFMNLPVDAGQIIGFHYDRISYKYMYDNISTTKIY